MFESINNPRSSSALFNSKSSTPCATIHIISLASGSQGRSTNHLFTPRLLLLVHTMSNNVDTISKTLSSPPPPTLEEIMATFNAQENGDKELLAAIVRAKEAEELRVAAVASLQETIMQLQHALAQASGLISPRTPPRRGQSSKSVRHRTASRSNSR